MPTLATNYPEMSQSNRPLVEVPSETRVVEYKGPLAWRDARWKVVRAALALANVDTGGSIVIGVAELTRGTFDPIGLPPEQAQTFANDEISRLVNEYASPAISLSTEIGAVNSKIFVVISIAPFDQIPIVCKKDGENLAKGTIYTRATAMNESVAVPGESEMREIIDRATDLQVRRMAERFRRMGLLFPPNAATPTSDAIAQARQDRLRLERGSFE